MDINFIVENNTFTLRYISGKVKDNSKGYETKVSGSTNYHGNNFSVSSSTVIHDKIFLELENGQETVLELKDWDIACLPEHEIIAAWIVKNNKSSKYIGIKNCNLNIYKKDNIEINRIANSINSWYSFMNLPEGLKSIGCLFYVVLIGYLIYFIYSSENKLFPLLLMGLFIFIKIRKYSKVNKVSKEIRSQLDSIMLKK